MRSKTHTQKSAAKEHALIPVSQHSTRTQSAMEYLMTYGWALLIIAIVMTVFFQLGIFNPFYFAPKAQPGSCKVFRSVQGASLFGECIPFHGLKAMDFPKGTNC